MTDIRIRTSRPNDAAELRRLAALDSATVPNGELLVAEEEGRMIAAYSLDDHRAIADPFRPTADVVDMLRLRSAGRSSAEHIHSRLLPTLRLAS
jgi:hypothetical protein